MGKQVWMREVSKGLAFLGLLAGCNSGHLEFVDTQPEASSYDDQVESAPLPGHLEGQFCDRASGEWMVELEVELASPLTLTTQVTDGTGRVRFSPIAPGAYELRFPTVPSLPTLPTSVYSGVTSRVGDLHCEQVPGTLEGQICGPDGRWLDNAQLTIVDSLPVLETRTDSDGFFKLEGIPPGNQNLEISRGSYSTRFSAFIHPGEVTTLAEPVCIPPTTPMAVITGIYDEIQIILQALGYEFRAHFTDHAPGITYPLTPDGSVDLINGASSQYWLREFLSDPLWMQEYQIILLNCGLVDLSLTNAPDGARDAAQNLRNYVENGGSLYASDWASEIIRLAFPGRIAFLGADDSFGSSRAGVDSPHQSAFIRDEGLARNLGSSEALVNLNLPLWSVMQHQRMQPEDLTILVEGKISHYISSDNFEESVEAPETPLVVAFTHGNGRVLVTSPHLEGQTSPDLEGILRYIVFEL